MSTALYRRYRPESFADVIGQEHVTAPLRAALRAGKVSHAYLFSGPRGCGKTTSARIFARCLNCETGPTDIPCGTCASCRDLARGGPGSLDVVEIDAASHNGVDDARELRERAAFAPARDRYKIFILDEAHMVTPQGFNALLKLVEEPPAHVKFVFATTEPEKVIGTIRSRTHHYPFRLVPPEDLGSYLKELSSAEAIGIQNGVIPLIVRAGGGSVRDTLSVLDQLMAGAVDSEIGYDRAVQLLGYTSVGLLDDAVGALAGIDGAALFRVVDHVVESGHDPKRFTEDFLQRLRDLVVLAIAGDAGRDAIHGIPDDQLDAMARQANALGARRASISADTVHQALVEMTGATSPRLQLELLCARLVLAQTSATSAPQSQPQPQLTAPASQQVMPVAGESGAGSRVVRGADRPLPQLPKFGKPPRGRGAASAGDQLSATAGTVASSVPDPARTPSAEGPDSSGVVAASGANSGHRAGSVAMPDLSSSGARAPETAPSPECVGRQVARSVTRPDGDQKPVAAVETAGQMPETEAAELLRRRWHEVLEVLKGISRVTWTLVQDHAVVGAITGQSAAIRFQIEPLRQRFATGPNADHLAEAIFQAVGLRLAVQAVGANEPAPQSLAAVTSPGPSDVPVGPPRATKPEFISQPAPVSPAEVSSQADARELAATTAASTVAAPSRSAMPASDPCPAAPAPQPSPEVPAARPSPVVPPTAAAAPKVPVPGTSAPSGLTAGRPAPSVPPPGGPLPIVNGGTRVNRPAPRTSQTSAGTAPGQSAAGRPNAAELARKSASEPAISPESDSEDEFGGARVDDQVVEDSQAELTGVQLLKSELGGVVIEEITEA